MAQFGHNIYGTSYYGKTNAVYGSFTSEQIDAQETLTNGISFKIIAYLPKVTYSAFDEDLIYTGTWTDLTNAKQTVDGTVTFKGSLSGIYANVTGTGTYTLDKIVNGTAQTVSSGSVSDGINIQNLEYAQYELSITGEITIQGITVNACHVNLYAKAASSLEALQAASFTELPVASKVVATQDDVADLYPEAQVLNDDTFVIIFGQNFGTGMRYYQFQVEMITSDNNTAPIVRSLEVSSDQASGLYDTTGGIYTAVFDFGPTFSRYDKIDWESDEPESTSLEITTQSSDGLGWSIVSLPYSKDTTQVRLQSEYTQGYIKIPLVSPRHLKEWDLLNITWFGRKDSDAISPLVVELYDESNTLLTTINNPFASNNIKHVKKAGLAVPMYAKLTLARPGTNYNSPAINSVTLIATCEYTQTKHQTSSISRVYGEKQVNTISNLAFTDLPEPEYGLIDYTITPYCAKNIEMYWASERNSVFRDLTVATLGDDTICVISKEPYFYNYGIARIYYDGQPTVYTTRMSNSFISPKGYRLNTSLKYQYKAINGWVNGENLELISNSSTPNLTITWAHPVDSNHPDVTALSEVNGYVVNNEPRNDDLIFTLTWDNVTDYSSWTSQEFISDEIIVNPNGLYIPYVNDFQLLPSIDDFAYVEKNCYKLEVIPSSVKRNGIHVPDQKFETIFEIIYPTDDELYTVDENNNVIPAREYLIEDVIIRGQGETDRLRYPFVKEIIGIYDTPQTSYPVSKALADYHENDDYVFDYETSTIDWAKSSHYPAPGSKYYVYYVCKKPKYARIQIACNYTETKTVRNAVWRSATIYEYEGVCAPGNDYISAKLDSILPPTKQYWPDLPSNATDFRYIISDDNPWVEVYLDADNRMHGTLGKRSPSTNWYPKIKPGYYYIGKDEYYLYVEPVELNIGYDKIEQASNIEFLDGINEDNAINGAVLIQDASTNLILNSSFNLVTRDLAYICDFSTKESMPTGTSKQLVWI